MSIAPSFPGSSRPGSVLHTDPLGNAGRCAQGRWSRDPPSPSPGLCALARGCRSDCLDHLPCHWRHAAGLDRLADLVLVAILGVVMARQWARRAEPLWPRPRPAPFVRRGRGCTRRTARPPPAGRATRDLRGQHSCAGAVHRTRHRSKLTCRLTPAMRAGALRVASAGPDPGCGRRSLGSRRKQVGSSRSGDRREGLVKGSRSAVAAVGAGFPYFVGKLLVIEQVFE